MLSGHGIGCHVTLLAPHRRRELAERMVLVSSAPSYTDDRDAEGGFSSEFATWWEAQTANQGTHIAQTYAELGERLLFLKDPRPAVSLSVPEQALD